MLEEMINTAIDKKIANDYSHVQLPSAMTARIAAATEIDDVTFKYDLKIIDKNGDDDDQYPIIPDVMSRLELPSGAIVAIALLYGALNPFILGEVL